MGFIKDWLEQKEQNKLLVKEALYKREAEKLEVLRLEAEKEEEKEAAIYNEKLRMESPIPWYELVGDKYDIEKPPLAPVTERYRWNKAFITHLREEGFTGQHDYDAIAEWEKDVEEKRATRIALIRKEELKKSSEPWVEIVSEDYDEDTKQVSIKLDWNYAFIKMLRVNGYQGNSEQDLIDKYFKRLSEDIAGDLHGAKYDG